MPYHTGRSTRQRTQQRQSQAQPNQTTPSVVTPVVTNVGGRFQAQIPWLWLVSQWIEILT